MVGWLLLLHTEVDKVEARYLARKGLRMWPSIRSEVAG